MNRPARARARRRRCAAVLPAGSRRAASADGAERPNGRNANARARARAARPPVASKAGAPPEPQPALVHCRPHPRSRSRSPSPSPGPDPGQVRAARLSARITREERGKGLQRVIDLATFLGTPTVRPGWCEARGRPARGRGYLNVFTVFMQIFWPSHCLARVIKVKNRGDRSEVRAPEPCVRCRGCGLCARPLERALSAAPLQAPSRSHRASGLVS